MMKSARLWCYKLRGPVLCQQLPVLDTKSHRTKCINLTFGIAAAKASWAACAAGLALAEHVVELLISHDEQ